MRAVRGSRTGFPFFSFDDFEHVGNDKSAKMLVPYHLVQELDQLSNFVSKKCAVSKAQRIRLGIFLSNGWTKITGVGTTNEIAARTGTAMFKKLVELENGSPLPSTRGLNERHSLHVKVASDAMTAISVEFHEGNLEVPMNAIFDGADF